nr:MFS transporter [Corynebacterium sp. 76QC2CO]
MGPWILGDRCCHEGRSLPVRDRSPRSAALLPVYVGGFVGPFSAQATSAILPTVAATFGITVQQAGLAITVYLVPFAVLMLISARIVRGFEPRNVVNLAYVVTFLGALIALLSPWWPMFLVGLAIMGTANAFTMPLLQNILQAMVPPHQLAPSLGTYAAAQAFGMFTSPLLAGFAAKVNWQLTYLVVIAAVLFILFKGLPKVGSATPSGGHGLPETESKVPVLGTIIHILATSIWGFCTLGIGALVGLNAATRFNLDTGATGAVVMSGGLATFILGRPNGVLINRLGARSTLIVSAVGSSVGIWGIDHAPNVWVLVAMWAIALVSAQAAMLAVIITVLGAPGGKSLNATVQAFRFFSSAAAPLVLLPLYLSGGEQSHLAFSIPAVCVLVAGALEACNPVLRRRK